MIHLFIIFHFRDYSWLIIMLFITNTNRVLFHDKEEPTSIARLKTPVALRNYSGFNVCFI